MQLFQQTQKLDTTRSSIPQETHNSNDNKRVGQASRSAAFQLCFPTASSSWPSGLPSTMRKSSTTLDITVDYTIVFTVRYSLRCRIRRTKSVKRDLLFQSEPAIVPLKPSTIGWLPAEKLCPKLCPSAAGVGVGRPNSGLLPVYTPSLQFKVKPLALATLSEGQKRPIRFIFHAPPELLHEHHLYLSSITVLLKSCTVVSSGTRSFDLTETEFRCGFSGRIGIDQGCFEVDSGLWGIIDVSHMLPTFSSSLLRLEYMIEAVAQIAKGNGETRVSLPRRR